MEKLRRYLSKWTSGSLSAALIGVAVLTILIALFIKNPWLKAGVLAYEILP